MENINLAHVHLLLNHLPTIGFGLGLCIYVAAYFGSNESLKKTGLILFFLVAVMAIPTFVSGSAAERVLCPEHKCVDGVSEPIIRAHEDAALIALVAMEITGFFSWLALWQLRRSPRLAPWNGAVVLLVSVISFGLMAVAANDGGEIRHAEIRAASETPPAVEEGAAATGIARSIGAAIAGNTGIGWLWPAFETIHFVGLCLLFAVVLVVDLRILGMAKGLSFKSIYQLLPFGMLGFMLNLVTGMGFFLAAPGQYINNIEFHRKLVFIILAAFNVLYFMLVDEAWVMGPDDNAPFKAKLAAASGIFIWLCVLYYGHMLPFLGNAF
jgi:uncharacterized membrane protein